MSGCPGVTLPLMLLPNILFMILLRLELFPTLVPLAILGMGALLGFYHALVFTGFLSLCNRERFHTHSAFDVAKTQSELHRETE